MSEKLCPVVNIGILYSCVEKGCALWNDQRNACALVALSEELADMRAEAKQKRMAESMKEE